MTQTQPVDSKGYPPPDRRHRVRVWMVLLVVLVLGAGLWLIANYVDNLGSEVAVGTYLTGDGQSYLVVERGRFGALRVAGGRITLSPIWFPAPRESHVDASFSSGRLVISLSEEFGDPSGGDDFSLSGVFTFESSETRPGDWDLVAAEVSGSEHRALSLFSGRFWGDVAGSSSVGEAFSKLGGAFGIRPDFEALLPANKVPVRSFLSRVDDPRAVEFFQLRAGERDPQRALKLIRQLAAEHPNHPLVTLHAIGAEAAEGDPAEGRRRWGIWDAAHGGDDSYLLRNVAWNARRNLGAAEFRRDYPDIKHYAATFAMSAKGVDLATRHKSLRDALAADRLMFEARPMITPNTRMGSAAFQVPNFLEMQIQVKADRTRAMLALLAGDREDSLTLLAADYRLGQSLNAGGFLINRLIGIAVRGIATKGLEVHVLNAVETPEEARHCWAMLQRLHETPDQEDGSRLLFGELGGLMGVMESPTFMPNFSEMRTRHTVADVMFQNLRVAAAVRAFAVTNGALPSGPGDLAEWFPKGLPMDAFTSHTAPLVLATAHVRPLVYSVGPDGADNSGAFEYDPTNGTISGGDVITRLPLKREFPFPKGGVKAANSAEFLAQFPNGLPPDGYADHLGMPLSILESTTTQPLVVFSFGPDADQQRSSTPVHLDASQRFIQPVVKRCLPTGADGRLLDRYPVDHWALGALYDPTNGTTSAGDIFIEIPKRE